MSFTKSLIFSVAALFATQAAAQSVTYRWGVNMLNQTFRRGIGGWELIAGPPMNQVSIGTDGTVWGLEKTPNATPNIRRWNGVAWEVFSGQLKQISVGSAQVVWGVNNANEVFRSVGNGWEKMPGSMMEVSAAADGTVWALDPTGGVFRWTGSSWLNVPGQLKHISAGSSQHVWGVDSSGQVFRRAGSAWQSLGGSLSQVSVGAGGEASGVNSANEIFDWTASGWQKVDGQLVNISVGPTATGAHLLIGGQIWMEAAPTVQAGRTPVSGCLAGSQPPTKADLDTLLQYAQSRGNAAAFLISSTGFKAKPGDVIVSSTRVFPDASSSDPASYTFWALDVSQVSFTQLSNTAVPPPSNLVSRCIAAFPTTQIPGDISECSVLPGSTVDAASVNVSNIQITDLMRQVKAPTRRFQGVNPYLAPITPHPDGSGYLLWTSTANRAILTRINAAGEAADPGSDEDLGPAVETGALATNGQTIAYLLRSALHKLEFRVKGGASTTIMDNDVPAGNQPVVLFSGRGLRFNDAGGKPVWGTEAMYYPMELHRGSVLFGGGKWFASFDHYNNFNAYSNPSVANGHTGAGMTFFNADGSQPRLGLAWGASHSTDMRAISDGDRIINIHLGDAYPLGLEMRVTDVVTGVMGPGQNLFEKARFADTLISAPGETPLYGIAGNGGGLTAGKLGDLVQTGCGLYALTYTIQPMTFTFNGKVYTSTPDETGLLVLDKNANIVSRSKIRSGSDVETLKSARWGKNAILVAWKTKGIAEYWMMLVDARGAILQDAQKLPGGITFSSEDTFSMMKNGDIMWTTSELGNLKLFRLPAPLASDAAGLPSGNAISSGIGPASPFSSAGLQQDEKLTSPNRRFEALMQGDGNFVIYEEGSAIWSAQSQYRQRAPYRLAVQPDGNLVIYGSSDRDVSLGGFGVCRAGSPCIATWSTGSGGGSAPYSLKMQDDGNLVLYDGSSRAVWASWTQR